MGIVFKINRDWKYIQDDVERNSIKPSRIKTFEALDYIPITDRATAQVCVIQQGKKYGLYIADHTVGFGGPGTWCSPTKEPFPYDEIRYWADPFGEEIGLFACRVANKWGIIEVVDGERETNDKYDAVYGLAKRRVVVPCQYGSLEEADAQLGTHHEWSEPVPDGEYES